MWMLVGGDAIPGLPSSQNMKIVSMDRRQGGDLVMAMKTSNL
jgi:hypothetical protein